MSKASEPLVKEEPGEEFTRVTFELVRFPNSLCHCVYTRGAGNLTTFEPDLSRFGMEKLDPDMVAIISRNSCLQEWGEHVAES